MATLGSHLPDSSVFYINPLYIENLANEFNFNENFEFKGNLKGP